MTPKLKTTAVNRPVNKGDFHLLQNFFPPLVNCFGHNLKDLGSSQETLHLSWCLKLVTGVAANDLEC